MRWAWLLGRLAGRALLTALQAVGAGQWFTPIPPAAPFDDESGTNPADGPVSIDPDELDAWLRRVLREAGTYD